MVGKDAGDVRIGKPNRGVKGRVWAAIFLREEQGPGW